VPLEVSCEGEVLWSLGASGAKVQRVGDTEVSEEAFCLRAIFEPYICEEEARMMNGR
jgi:hypothetical protein